VGARHVGEPHDHKSGGLDPLGPIGVYAYVCNLSLIGCCMALIVRKVVWQPGASIPPKTLEQVPPPFLSLSPPLPSLLPPIPSLPLEVGPLKSS